MSVIAMQMSILHSLVRRPSRASVAAIGHECVLNGSPPVVRIRGLEALSSMVCDWSVAILEEAINDPRRGYVVRRYAIGRLCLLVKRAVRLGYAGITMQTCHQLENEALLAIRQTADQAGRCEIESVEALCNHLSQAVADGIFPELPDF